MKYFRWLFFECLVIMDILCAFEESNAPNFLDGDSITLCFLLTTFRISPHSVVLTSKMYGKTIVVWCWASGLGIGFWLRGVQPRTTVR